MFDQLPGTPREFYRLAFRLARIWMRDYVPSLDRELPTDELWRAMWLKNNRVCDQVMCEVRKRGFRHS